MVGSLRAACFNRRVCVRCPFGNRFAFLMIKPLFSTIGNPSNSVFERVMPLSSDSKQPNQCGAVSDFPVRNERMLPEKLALHLAVGARLDPIPESPAHRFMLSELGCNLPVRNLFSTFTDNVTCKRTFPLDCIADDNIIWQCFLAIWAYNLAFHLFTFLQDRVPASDLLTE